jgi:DNA-binding NtrC family response regulator
MITSPDNESKLINELSQVMVSIPPLREQADDLVFLSNQILTELIETHQVPPIKFTTQALNALNQYDWPGNLEQFTSVIKSLAMSAEKGVVDAPQVSSLLNQFQQSDQPMKGAAGLDFDLPLRELREELERRYFEYHITQENGNMSRVAQRVGLERTHLYRKLKQLGVQFSRR